MTEEAKLELEKMMLDLIQIKRKLKIFVDARMHGIDLGQYCDRSKDFCYRGMLDRFLKTFC